MNKEILLNNFATRTFRDTADGDYISARLAFRAQLIPQFLWSSLQAIEKYLKCILVFNRIPAERGHDLSKLIKTLNTNAKFQLQLTDATNKFLIHLDTYGRHRYFETSFFIKSGEIVSLDRAVWEIRRYARILDYDVSTSTGQKVNMLQQELRWNERAMKSSPHKFRINGGRLESIIDKPKHPSREPLLWQNGFYGRRPRKFVIIPGRSEFANSPLFLYPEILDEVLKYVHLPKDIINAYRNAKLK